jgi:hypothetical protein
MGNFRLKNLVLMFDTFLYWSENTKSKQNYTKCAVYFSLMEFIPSCRDISLLLNVIYSSNVFSNYCTVMLH